MAWSGFSQTHVRVWKQSWCTGITRPGFWQDATGPLPVSDFLTRFRSSTDVPDNTVQNQPGSDLVLADCVRFWPNGSGPEASQCARTIRPASGQGFPAKYRIAANSNNAFHSRLSAASALLSAVQVPGHVCA